MASAPERLRTTARSSLTKSGSAALAFERLGAFTLADKLDRIRLGGDIVAVPLPLGPGQLRAHRIKMRRFEGKDLAVEQIVTGGWLGFERPLPDVLIRTVRQTEGLVYDVGANSGLYALLAAEARPGVRVHAFEPFPPVLKILRENVALNRAAGRIKIVAGAAADIDEDVLLYVPRDVGAIESSCSLDPNFKEDVVEEIKVKGLTLDHYWAAEGKPRVGVLKVDTEGTEHRVLQGAADLIATERPIVFYEVLPRAEFDLLHAIGEQHQLVDVRLSAGEAVIGGHVVYDEHAWNHAFVPVEKLDAQLQLYRDSGLVVTRL